MVDYKRIERVLKEKIYGIIFELYGDVYYDINISDNRCRITIYNRGLKGMFKLVEDEYANHVQEIVNVNFQVDNNLSVNEQENNVIDFIDVELENILYKEIDDVFEVNFIYANQNSIMIYPYGTSKEEIDSDYEEWKQRQIDDVDEGWRFVGEQKRGMLKRE